MTYDALSREHYESLSTLEGISLLVDQYAKLNSVWLVDDLEALSAFVELRRGVDALKAHHHVLETLANERTVEMSLDLKRRRGDYLRRREAKGMS